MLAKDSGRLVHRVAGGGKCLRACAEERLRRRAVELDLGAAKRAERREKGSGLPERNESRTRTRRGREAQPPRAVLLGGRFEGEAQRGAVGGGDAERRAPDGEVAHERADLAFIGPLHTPVVAAERAHPSIVHGIGTRRARLKGRAAAEAREAVHEPHEERALRHVKREPPRGEAFPLLHEVRQVRTGGDGTRGGAERLSCRQHVIPEEHARLEAARPHVGEEHQEVLHGGKHARAV